MSKRISIGVFIVGLFVVAWWARAQTDGPAKAGRAIYPVKQGSAKELGAVLTKHFKGDVEALPDPTGGVLLISAPPAVLEEVIKLLGQLDRRPRMISIEVLIADVVQKKPERAEPADKELDERELTGSIPDVLSKVEALRKKGRLTGLKRVQLSAVEGLQASSAMLESKPYSSGVAEGGGGGSDRRVVRSTIATWARWSSSRRGSSARRPFRWTSTSATRACRCRRTGSSWESMRMARPSSRRSSSAPS